MKCLLTGSRVYGPATEKSDIDIVVMEDDAIIIKHDLRKQGVKVKTKNNRYMNSSFYFCLGGLKFNIVIATDEGEYERWKQATEQMKTIRPVLNRKERYKTFQRFFKMVG